jgi:hypothetical protein
MKTVNEIRIEAIRVINKIITLKANVANGCYSDLELLNKELPRLETIKTWATNNDQLQEIKHYLNSKYFGQNEKFCAVEVANFFNN